MLCGSRCDQRSSNALHKCVHFSRRHNKKEGPSRPGNEVMIHE